MPGFGGHANDAAQLSDRDVAVLVTYVLAHYGPGDTAISERQVSEVRHGGPSSPLVSLARGGLAVAAIVVALLIGFLIIRRRGLSARRARRLAAASR